MKKFVIQVAALLLVAFAGLYVYQHPDVLNIFLPKKITQLQQQKQQSIRINNVNIKAEVSDTEVLRARGLGGRDQIATDSGMLLVFPQSQKYQFWMKGMKFPIDMIFIDQGKVVDILKNLSAPAQSQKDNDLPIYKSVVPMDMVLEVNAGFADANDIKVGDSVFLIKK